MKTKIVVFDESKIGARVHIRSHKHEFQKSEFILINPDLSKVAGLSPSLWQLKGGSVVRSPKAPAVITNLAPMVGIQLPRWLIVLNQIKNKFSSFIRRIKL